MSMDSRNPIRNLAETLHSLLGTKANLTSNWLKSVCDIMHNVPLDQSSTEAKPREFETSGQPMDTKDNDDSEVSISKIKDDLAGLTSQINKLNVLRRQVLNDLLDMKGNIRVFCRIRPLMEENSRRLIPVQALDSNSLLLKLGDNNRSKNYSFDRVFLPCSSQDEVFTEVEPLIKSVIDGYNACIFAYGQTGTGKTFTMEGSTDAPGVVPRAIKALFKQAATSNHPFRISFSMLEIYMGNLKDLFVPKPTKATDPIPPCISIQTDPTGRIEIENLVAIQVNDFNQALRLYRLGCRVRSTASTNSNRTSSRSHCMIRLAITCIDAPERRRETNKIWLIDLGGSERVLKTKAWGKRLDEGKAINLSLSALGDVINALQIKKHHIPYRNSKLTQVLKDSLGGDSKALMLVHISLREEDLCETICSLNFATRVKRIHLGHGDTIEVRKQKEVAIANLQQQMKEIEDEQLNVRRDIEKLNKILESLTGAKSEEQMDVYHLYNEEPLTENKVERVTAVPLSKLPRFMRPTICSQRKSGTSYQTSEWTIPVLTRRRRSSSQHAQSVHFPVKDHSKCNSDSSISRSSCLVGFNIKNGADNTTEYSQDTAETDVRMMDLDEQERRVWTPVSPKDDTSHGHMSRNRQTNKINHIKFSKVDNWLHLQKGGPNTRGHTHMTKQVSAIPFPKKKQEFNGQSEVEKICDEEVYNHECTAQKVINCDEKDKLFSLEAIGRPVLEVAIDKPLMKLKGSLNKNSTSLFISLLQTTERETMMQTQESTGSSSTEDNECNAFSSVDSCCYRSDIYKFDGTNAMSIMQAIKTQRQCSHNCLLNKHESCKRSPSEVDSVCTSVLDLESCGQQRPNEWNRKEGKWKDSDVCFQPLATGRLDILHLRSQRSLFTKNANQEDLAMRFTKTQGKAQTKGIFYLVKEKIGNACAVVLLGLGIYSLGFEDDFFYGLIV